MTDEDRSDPTDRPDRTDRTDTDEAAETTATAEQPPPLPPPPPPPPRVGLVTNVLSHYRVPCFRALADRLPGSFEIFTLTETMEHRHFVMADAALSGLPVQTLPGRRWRRPPQDDLHWNTVGPVQRERFDVLVLSSWAEPTFLHLWLRNRLRSTRILFWIESTRWDRARRPGRELLKRILLRGAAGCLVPGRRAAEYCADLGMDRSRIFTVPNATDRSFYRSRADELRPQRERLRRERGIENTPGHPEPTVFLFAGRLVESIKGVELVLRSLARLAATGEPVQLRLAGEGPDELRYRDLAEDIGCPAVFLGNLDRDRLCEEYAVADALVLPSRSEVWGFVANEAMEFGLPLVLAEPVGAAPDLVGQPVGPLGEGEHGTGFVLPRDDADRWDMVLRSLVDPEPRARMRAAARNRIEHFSPERWAEAVESAARALVG